MASIIKRVQDRSLIFEYSKYVIIRNTEIGMTIFRDNALPKYISSDEVPN